MTRLLATGIVGPVVAGLGGGLGVWAARGNVDSAPVVVAVALVLAALAAYARWRGVALAALGVGAAAAFASPAGLGPLLVATGVIVAAAPAAIDRRVSHWPDLVDGLVALPALAGLASVVAAQPSERGLAVGFGAAVLSAGSWWRGPRRGVAEPQDETVVSYLGAVGGLMLVFAPGLFDVLGVLPDATRTAGRGLAAGIGVFALALLLPEVWTLRLNRTNRAPSAAAHRR